jgi:hypothetical protein
MAKMAVFAPVQGQLCLNDFSFSSRVQLFVSSVVCGFLLATPLIVTNI